MQNSSTPKPPPHLCAPTRHWWQAVIDGYELEPHHLRLLTLASEAWDQCVEAREAIAAHGLTFEDRFGQPRARPEVAIERDNRIAFARLVRELGLDVHEPEEPRPPALHGNAALRVAEG